MTTKKGEPAYWLLLRLRWSAVDAGTIKPIGHEMPVPWAGQYPPGFPCGSVLSHALFAPIPVAAGDSEGASRAAGRRFGPIPPRRLVSGPLEAVEAQKRP